MEVQLRNVKYAEFASEETLCFEASVCIDGHREGTASNDGRGGATMIWPPSLGARLNAYAATLPPFRMPHDHPDKPGMPWDMPRDADMLLADLLQQWLVRRDLKRALAKRVVFVTGDGSVRETRTLTPAALQAQLARADRHRAFSERILNEMNFEDALVLFRAYVERNSKGAER